MNPPTRAAFYDFDGTLASSNVVTRYAFFAKNHPSKTKAFLRYAKVVLGVPVWLALDFYSRRLFNEVFFSEYRGLSQEFLTVQAERLFEEDIRPKIFAGAKAQVERDRAEGFRLVLVSGGMDFALGPVVRYLGFDGLISNRLRFEDGIATGRVVSPLLAEQEKMAAMRDYCREYNVDTAHSKAYSDSLSDVPMLEAVGQPVVVRPGRRLRRLAQERGWAVLDLNSA